MKRFLAISLFVAAILSYAMACIWEWPTHNGYMFSVFRNGDDYTQFSKDIDLYWANYANGKTSKWGTFYFDNTGSVRQAATDKGDTEMLNYLDLFDKYMEVANAVSQNVWDYPTKEQLAQRKQTLQEVLTTATAYKGKKLNGQYALLVMRANMMLGNDAASISYWEKKAKRLPADAWREAMRNIYARALYKTGKWREASDIYAEQGDMTSIKWMTRKYRNLAGIKWFYQMDANSPTLNYLVQDFVNNAQETIDMKPEEGDDEDWLFMIGAQAIYQQEVTDFISFANGVVKDGKTKNPCLWRSATAMLHYLFGHQNEATADINEAMNLDGTPRMCDNARAIRLLVATKNKPSAQFLVNEMEWLDSKISEEDSSLYGNHYAMVKERVVYNGLAAEYDRIGNHNMATALYAMMENYQSSFDEYSYQRLCTNYSGEYATLRLDSLSADELIQYYKFLSSKRDDAFEQYVADHTDRNADYYNDRIGTKLMAEGRFAEAIPYLQKVSLSFLNKQAITFYMAQRDFNVERWFKRQPLKYEPKYDDEGTLLTATPTLKNNPKIDYCRTIIDMQSRYDLMREGASKQQLAYELAVRYCQASYHGDCWYLTHYGKSISDSTIVGELDYIATTVKLLSESAKSTDKALRYHSLYAIATMPDDPWFTEGYDENYNLVHTINPQSRQYANLAALSRFANENPKVVDRYTTKCDVLARFRKATSR